MSKKMVMLKLLFHGKDEFNQDMNVLLYTVWVSEK